MGGECTMQYMGRTNEEGEKRTVRDDDEAEVRRKGKPPGGRVYC